MSCMSVQFHLFHINLAYEKKLIELCILDNSFRGH